MLFKAHEKTLLTIEIRRHIRAPRLMRRQRLVQRKQTRPQRLYPLLLQLRTSHRALRRHGDLDAHALLRDAGDLAEERDELFGVRDGGGGEVGGGGRGLGVDVAGEVGVDGFGEEDGL